MTDYLKVIDRETRRALKDLGDRLDKMQTTDTNLKGRKIIKSARAVDPDDVPTLAQVEEMIPNTEESGVILEPNLSAWQMMDLFDDFDNIVHWAIDMSGAGGGADIIDCDSENNPGIAQIKTDTANGNWAELRRTPSGKDGFLIANMVHEANFVLRAPTPITSMQFSAGVGDALATVPELGANSWRFQYSSSTGKVQAVCRAAGVETAVDVITALVADTFYQLRIMNNRTNVEFFVNEVIKATIDTNLMDLTTPVTTGMVVKTLTNARRFLDVDLFSMISYPIGQRWG